jgi:hypothetical protein
MGDPGLWAKLITKLDHSLVVLFYSFALLDPEDGTFFSRKKWVRSLSSDENTCRRVASLNLNL